MFFPHLKLTDEMIAKLPPNVQAHFKKQQQNVPKQVVSTQQSVSTQVVPPQQSVSKQVDLRILPNKPVAGGKPGDLYSNQDNIHKLPPHLQGRNNLGLHKLSCMDSTKHTAPTTVPVKSELNETVPVKSESNETVPVKSVPVTHKPTRREILKATEMKK